ncbi:hypothetical protein [Salinicoccus luteus]|uniref:hypothetical protein n=1 Tax=Salinicoccus luteus TaxID=367840 RepID=UPI0006923324|nr:hypothetical protein [Salinicoccus luteus]
MAFFKYLTWDNSHMDLRYTKDEYGGDVHITKVYRDARDVDLERVNRKYSDQLRDTQRAIYGNRLGMLLAFIALVIMPALVISVIQSNILLIAAITVYTILAYFIVEAINQVEINRLLYRLDREIKSSPRIEQRPENMKQG